MKKNIVILLLFTSFILLLTACTREPANPALPFIAVENDELGCIELTRDGKVYRPFGIVSDKSMRGNKIGVRSGDENENASSSIYALNDYDPNEWILETDVGFMPGGDMLFKEIAVTSIPPDLEQFKMYDF